MKRNLSLIFTILALAALSCNSLIKLPFSSLKTIPVKTFSIDEPLPVDEEINDVVLQMVASTAKLTLSGEADGLIEGQIQYNVAEWNPTLTRSEGGLRIEQNLPDGRIGGTPDESLNEWEINLSDEFQRVHINCPSGNYTLVFTNSLPGVTNISIEMGSGNLQLLFPVEIPVSVEVNRGPVSITTKGMWSANDNTYTTGSSNPVWDIKVQIGVGKLTLASQ